MIPAPIDRPGGYGDVAVWLDGRLLHTAVEGSLVRCWLEDGLIWQQHAPEGLLWCRCAVVDQAFYTIHQGQSGQAWVVGEGQAKAYGMTLGVQPVGISPCAIYIVRPGFTYDRVGFISRNNPFPAGVPPTSSQGFSDVQPDGTLWFADVHRTLHVAGVTLTYPNVRGPVTVGQVDPPGIAAVVGSRVTRVIEGDAFEPHVAVSPTGRVAICARTPHGAAYVATTIQELS